MTAPKKILVENNLKPRRTFIHWLCRLSYLVIVLALWGSSNRAAAQDTQSCTGAGDGEKASDYTDCRGAFETSFYVGLGIDTFAGSDTLKYLNPGDSGKTHERAVGGFDFAYRLLGDPTPKTSDPRFEKSLWVYGETIHGVRSVDVNCTQNPDIPVCQKNLVQPTNPGNQVYYILRNATSLEGYMGLRYEFLGLQQQADTPANIYIKAQAGFLDVAGSPGSALDMHHLAVGAVATKGKFQDSYLEAGWGRSDTFATARRRRVKVDGYLEREIGRGVSFFTELFVDTDLGRGSDAIQTYIGFSFDLENLLQKK